MGWCQISGSLHKVWWADMAKGSAEKGARYLSWHRWKWICFPSAVQTNRCVMSTKRMTWGCACVNHLQSQVTSPVSITCMKLAVDAYCITWCQLYSGNMHCYKYINLGEFLLGYRIISLHLGAAMNVNVIQSALCTIFNLVSNVLFILILLLKSVFTV